MNWRRTIGKSILAGVIALTLSVLMHHISTLDAVITVVAVGFGVLFAEDLLSSGDSQ